MGIKYYKLFALLAERGMQKTDLLKIMSSSTLAKLGKGAPLNTKTIDEICQFLKCQPVDIMECYTTKSYIDSKTGIEYKTEVLTGIDEINKSMEDLQNTDTMKMLIELLNNADPNLIDNLSAEVDKENKRMEDIKKQIKDKYEKE